MVGSRSVVHVFLHFEGRLVIAEFVNANRHELLVLLCVGGGVSVCWDRAVSFSNVVCSTAGLFWREIGGETIQDDHRRDETDIVASTSRPRRIVGLQFWLQGLLDDRSGGRTLKEFRMDIAIVFFDFRLV
jgi:hypothetical protein